jgi:hypothetical protein
MHIEHSTFLHARDTPCRRGSKQQKQSVAAGRNATCNLPDARFVGTLGNKYLQAARRARVQLGWNIRCRFIDAPATPCIVFVWCHAVRSEDYMVWNEAPAISCRLDALSNDTAK